MPKRYDVTPSPTRNGGSYKATFRDASGARVTRGLGTKNHGRAKQICGGLIRLYGIRPRNIADCPDDVDDDAKALYFNLKRPKAGLVIAPDDELPADPGAFDVELAAFPAGAARKAAYKILLERHFLRQRVKRLEGTSKSLNLKLQALSEQHEALGRSIVAREIEKAANAPGIDEALAQYEVRLTTSTTPGNAASCMSEARRFCAWLKPKPLSPLDITADQIGKYLDERTSEKATGKPLSRRRNLHIRLARFINWASETFDYPSQMARVSMPSKQRIAAEKGEIVWHTKKEVEAAIEGLPKRLRAALGFDGAELDRAVVYWKALVATLAYGGLRLSELCWLRVADLEIEKGGKRGRLRVTVVEDEHGGRHSLKTGGSHRWVSLEPDLLLPRIRAHLDAGGAGDFYLFAMPAGRRRRAREKGKGLAERWLPTSLGVMLRGHPGGAKRRKTPPLLPDYMNAQTLRHTAGSLLLRAGKSEEEVAAFLGNTPDVVRSNYARLTSKEVDVKL